MISLRLVAYTAGTDTRLGIMPEPTSLQLSIGHNTVGALELTYSQLADQGSLLAGGLETGLDIGVEVNWGSGWTEPPNCRFLLIKRSTNPADPARMIQLSCPSYAWLAGRVRNLNLSAVEGSKSKHAGERKFASASAGRIVKTLLDEHQDRRGVGVPLTRSGFSNTVDSAGANWAKTKTLYYPVGVDILTVLTALSDIDHCDWRTQGRALQMWNADSHFTDRAATVKLQLGRELGDAPSEETMEDLVTHILVRGEKKVKTTVQNTSGPHPWGYWEGFIDEGGIDSTAEAQDAAQKELAARSRLRGEYTRTLTMSDLPGDSLPFRDYVVGDWVTGPAVVGSQRMRVQQVTVTLDSDGKLAGSVVLNDRVLAAELKRASKLKSITITGPGSTGGSGIAPIPDGPDPRQPAAPTGLTVTDTVYLDAFGMHAVRIKASWSPVTTATDGTELEIARYELWGQPQGQTPTAVWRRITSSTGTEAEWLPFSPGSQWVFTVLAVGLTTIDPGVQSAPVTVTMGHDTVAPPAPSTPVVTAWLASVQAAWNGRDNTGAAMPADWVETRVHIGTTAGFTPSAANQVDSFSSRTGGIVNLTQATLSYTTPVYVKLVAVDLSGNVGAASAAGSATPRPAYYSDLATSAIDDIIADATDVIMPSVDGKTSNYYQTSAPTGTFTVGDTWFDTDDSNRIYRWSGSAWVAVNFGGAALADGIVTSTKLAAAVNTAISNAQTAANTAQATADGKGRNYYQTAAPTGGTYTVYDTWFDTDDGHRMYRWSGSAWVAADFGTSALADATIVNAKIADGTIQNAKIGSLDAGKVTTGTLSADRIGANTITASKVAITDFANYLLDSLTNPSAVFSGWTKTPSYLEKAGTGVQHGGYSIGTEWAVAPAEQWRFAATRTDVAGSTGWASIYVQYFNDSNVLVSTVRALALNTAGSFANVVTVPAGAAFARLGFFTEPNMPSGTTVQISAITIRRLSGGELIVDGAITTSKIAAGSITAASGIIADAAITNAKIADATIQSAKIASIDAASITTGILDANRLAANSVTAEKMVISGGNLLPDPTLQGVAAWTVPASTTRTPTGGYAGDGIVTVPAAATQRDVVTQSTVIDNRRPYLVRVTPGLTYLVQARVKTAGAPTVASGLWVAALGIDAAGAAIGSGVVGAAAAAGVAAGTWSTVQVIFTAPAGAAWMQVQLRAAAAQNTQAIWSTPWALQMASGSLIVDGSIQAKHLEAELVLTSEVVAGPPTATHARMNPAGFSAHGPDPADDVVKSFMRLGSDGLSFGFNPDVPAGRITGLGHASLASAAVGALSVGGETLDEILDPFPRGRIAYAESTSPVTGITATETPVMELRSTLAPGRLYELLMIGTAARSSVAGDIIEWAIRVAYDGNAVTTSSTLIRSGVRQNLGPATLYVTVPPITVDISTDGQAGMREARFLLTAKRQSGTGTIDVWGSSGQPAQLKLRDEGQWKPATSTGIRYTSVWSATAGWGHEIDGSDPIVFDWWVIEVSTQDYWTQLLFGGNAVSGETSQSLAAATSGASIIKAEIRVQVDEAYSFRDSDLKTYSYSPQLRLHPTANTTSNATLPGSYVTSAAFSPPQSRWVDVTSLWTTSHRGLYLSLPPVASGRTGGANGAWAATQIRLTYFR